MCFYLASEVVDLEQIDDLSDCVYQTLIESIENRESKGGAGKRHAVLKKMVS
jgi:hypothetical protein